MVACTKIIWFQVLTEDLQLIFIDTINVEEPKQETVQSVLNEMNMYNGKPKVHIV